MDKMQHSAELWRNMKYRERLQLLIELGKSEPFVGNCLSKHWIYWLVLQGNFFALPADLCSWLVLAASEDGFSSEVLAMKCRRPLHNIPVR